MNTRCVKNFEIILNVNMVNKKQLIRKTEVASICCRLGYPVHFKINVACSDLQHDLTDQIEPGMLYKHPCN